MIRWKDCEERYGEGAKSWWRRNVCRFEDSDPSRTCMGVSDRAHDDEPSDICKNCTRLGTYGIE